MKNEKKQQFNPNKGEELFGEFLSSLGFDWKNDPNMVGTPKRIVKMLTKEIAKSRYEEPPKITAFDNEEHYSGLVFQGDIEVKSLCSHHFLPFIGKAYVAYIPNPNGKIIGLSKLNRIVEYYSRQPQVQENLTQQIHKAIDEVIPDNLGVAVLIKAKHMCVYMRGIEHDSEMKTSKLSGAFLTDADARAEFYSFIK